MNARSNQSPERAFALIALVLLISTVLAGLLSAIIYLIPSVASLQGAFAFLRPLHTSAAVFWILSGATACIYLALSQSPHGRTISNMWMIHLGLWLVSLVGVFSSYASGHFGGREYWEYPPVLALPIAVSWTLLLIQFFRAFGPPRQWPVYRWMWMTGLLFFLFSFLENYLWLFTAFRQTVITDMTIQWKVNGSLVGSWNQIIYGTAFYLSSRLSGNDKPAHSALAFAMYFLGLFNLMFNWGHHIYTLPTAPYVRHIGYAVSMTEWIIFIRMMWQWRQALPMQSDLSRHPAQAFLKASEVWASINLLLALLMSVPAINLYTHGTHITVAHAMGTTIGINSMILLAGILFIIYPPDRASPFSVPFSRVWFAVLQAGLFILFISLNIAGLKKGIWNNQPKQHDFMALSEQLYPWFIGMSLGGVLLLIAIVVISYALIFRLIRFR